MHSSGRLDTRSSGKRKVGKVGGIWGADEPSDDDAQNYDEPSYDDDNQNNNNNNDYSPNYDDFPTSESYQQPRKKLGSSFGGNIKKRSKASSGQYEKKWVADIVKSGGVGCKVLNLPKYVMQFENLSKNHVFAQNTPKHKYFQMSKEKKTFSKEKKLSRVFWLIFCPFSPKIRPKNIFFKIRKCNALK